MRVRTRTIAAAAAAATLAVSGGAVLAASGPAAVASTTGAHAATMSVVKKPGLQHGTPNNDAFIAAVARQLNVSTARVRAALQSAFGQGRIDLLSPAFAAAARSLGVSTQQLNTALMHAKESLAPNGAAEQKSVTDGSTAGLTST